MALAVTDELPVNVYAGTRRIVETPTRYVAQVQLLWVDESNTCGEAGVPPEPCRGCSRLIVDALRLRDSASCWPNVVRHIRAIGALSGAYLCGMFSLSWPHVCGMCAVCLGHRGPSRAIGGPYRRRPRRRENGHCEPAGWWSSVKAVAGPVDELVDEVELGVPGRVARPAPPRGAAVP